MEYNSFVEIVDFEFFCVFLGYCGVFYFVVFFMVYYLVSILFVYEV